MRLRLLVLLFALLPTAAWSQASVYMCVELTTGIDRCQHVSVANPLPVTGTFTPSTSSANFTPVAAAAATATKGTLLGGQFDSTQKTLTDGQQAAASFSSRAALYVAVGADGFAVTNAGTFAAQATLPTTPTIAAGNGVVPASSSETGAGATTTASSVLASNLVIKGSAGNLYSFEVSADSTLSAAAWWIMIFNATALPSNGTVTPAKCYAMPSGATSYSGGFNIPVNFPTGITIGVSTTGCFTLTASVHAFLSGDFK